MASQAAYIPGIFSKEDTLGVTPKHPLWPLHLPCALNGPAPGPHGIGQQAPAGRRINKAPHTPCSQRTPPADARTAPRAILRLMCHLLGCHPASFLGTLKKGSPWKHWFEDPWAPSFLQMRRQEEGHLWPKTRQPGPSFLVDEGDGKLKQRGRRRLVISCWNEVKGQKYTCYNPASRHSRGLRTQSAYWKRASRKKKNPIWMAACAPQSRKISGLNLDAPAQYT